MEVSMWHLLRLALLSVGLGAGLYALWQTRTLILSALYPSAEEGGILQRWRLPKASVPYRFSQPPPLPAFFRHIGDFLAAILVALVFSVFFYAANDGIPRLFAFLGILLGAVLWKKTLGRLFFFLLTRLGALFRYAVLLLALPPAAILLGIGRRFLSCLIKASAILIKKQKKIYTNYKSRRYMRASVSAALRAGLSRRLSAALDQEERGEEAA